MNLGSFYDAGRSVAPDKVKAREHYTKAAQLGHPQGQYNTAFMYLTCPTVPSPQLILPNLT